MAGTDIAEAVCQYLLATGAITALVGTRIYPDDLPNNCTMPAIVYREVSDVESYHMQGADGLSSARIQVDSYGASAASANAVRRVVRSTMQGKQTTMGGVHVRNCFVENANGVALAPNDGADVWRYIRSIDLMITYQTKLT
ncbi:MAG: DUF3168 domain-containing protein [Caulobacteraceae bacterium]|nr:DUF3168 domain-containing protein [Caulobacteraceae bacterium]